MDYTVIHRPGIANVLPDRLSRIYDSDQVKKVQDLQLNLTEVITPSREVNNVPNLDVSKEEKLLLLTEEHAQGHFGSRALVKSLLSKGISWFGMSNDAIELVKDCVSCQRHNISQMGFHPLKTIEASLPMDHPAIDLKEFPLSKRMNHYCLVVVDICSRFVWLKAIPNKKDVTIGQELFKIFCDFGFPRIVQSDNGLEFVNRVVAELLKIPGVNHRTITPYHPQANGVAERMVQTTSQAIYKVLEGRDHEWDLFVPNVQFFTNLKVSERHGSTPYSLMFAREANHFASPDNGQVRNPLSEQDLCKRLDYMTTVVFPALSIKTKDSIKKMSAAFLKKHNVKSSEILPGSLVMVINELRKSKTEERYTGPYTVKRRSSSGPYILVDATGYEFVRPRSSLKLIKNGLISTTERAVIDRITEERKDDNNLWEYLVHWKDPTLVPQWVKAKDFDDYTPVREFFKSKSKQSST